MGSGLWWNDLDIRLPVELVGGLAQFWTYLRGPGMDFKNTSPGL